MKRKIPVLIALAIITLMTALSACSPRQAERKLERFEEKVEQQLEAVQDAIATTPAGKSSKLTAEEVKNIAVEHAGLQGQQVSRLRTTFDKDDRIPHYDVEFYHNGIEYDYEIHAENGNILSFDKDRD